jgi:hypothetical protein
MWRHQNMTTPAIRLAIGAATVLLTAACGSNTPSSITTPSTNTFHAEVVDSTGDAVVSPGGLRPPDLVHGTVDVSSAAVTVTIQFASGTFDRQSTRVNIELDTDQNPATGIVGVAGLGIDYVLDLWTLTNQAKVQQAMPAACAAGGSCYSDTGTVALSVGVDRMAATVPLAMLGNASGRLNYRVLAYASPQSTTPIAVADVMPDITLTVAHVP